MFIVVCVYCVTSGPWPHCITSSYYTLKTTTPTEDVDSILKLPRGVSHPERYTLSQKKRNIFEVAFLLEKSVYQ